MEQTKISRRDRRKFNRMINEIQVLLNYKFPQTEFNTIRYNTLLYTYQNEWISYVDRFQAETEYYEFLYKQLTNKLQYKQFKS